MHDGALHVVGQVTMGGKSVWRLDGEIWTRLGNGVSGQKLTSYCGNLYAGPERWNGTGWENVLQTDGWINDFTELAGLLVFGGSFTTAGGLPIHHVAAWDGHQVIDAFPGQARSVTELEVFRGELHAARYAYMSSQTCLVQTWNGDAWVDQPSLRLNDYTRTVTFMRVVDDRLLVGYRNHDIIIRDSEASLRSWDGQALSIIHHEWSTSTLSAALDDGDRWLIGGDFVSAGVSACWDLAYAAGGALAPVAEIGSGANDDVYALAANATTLAVSGSFRAIGGSWSPGAAFLADGVWSASAMSGLYDLDWQGDRLLALYSDFSTLNDQYAYYQDGAPASAVAGHRLRRLRDLDRRLPGSRLRRERPDHLRDPVRRDCRAIHDHPRGRGRDPRARRLVTPPALTEVDLRHEQPPGQDVRHRQHPIHDLRATSPASAHTGSPSAASRSCATPRTPPSAPSTPDDASTPPASRAGGSHCCAAETHPGR